MLSKEVCKSIDLVVRLALALRRSASNSSGFVRKRRESALSNHYISTRVARRYAEIETEGGAKIVKSSKKVSTERNSRHYLRRE